MHIKKDLQDRHEKKDLIPVTTTFCNMEERQFVMRFIGFFLIGYFSRALYTYRIFFDVYRSFLMFIGLF